MSYFSLQPYCFLPKLVGRFRKNHPNMNQTPPLWYYSISIFMKPNKGQSHKPLNICIWLLACKLSLTWLKVKDKTQPPQCHLKIPGNLRRSPSLLYGKSMTQGPSEQNSLQIIFNLLIWILPDLGTEPPSFLHSSWLGTPRSSTSALEWKDNRFSSSQSSTEKQVSEKLPEAEKFSSQRFLILIWIWLKMHNIKDGFGRCRWE